MSKSTPAIREVKPIPAPQLQPQPKNTSLVISSYKDLQRQPIKAFPPNTHLFVAFGLFMILGMGIFIGSHIVKPRGVASTMGGLIAVGPATQEEHYHYDKSCTTSETGEQVCTTRTSKKNN